MKHCINCETERFWECDHCGNYFSEDRINYYNNGDLRLCDECSDDYYAYCDNCGRLTITENMQTDGYISLCPDCRYNYYIECDNCGIFVHRNDMYEGNGCCYCETCWDDNNYDRIESSDYIPDFDFFSCSDEPEPAGYYGIELEIDKGEDRDDCAADINIAGKGNTYNKSDGSLDYGFEVVSHPCTLAYHMGELNWYNILETAKEYGFKSHDAGTCGLHIHVSNSMFGCEPTERDLNIAKLMLIFNEHWSAIKTFSRRTDSQIADWCKRPSNTIYEEDTEHQILDKVNNEKHCGRYRAINLTNYHTVEIRIFRGTLKYSTFIASLQFVDYLIQYCNKTSLKNLFKKSFKDIFKDCKHTELNYYLNVKGLI